MLFLKSCCLFTSERNCCLNLFFRDSVKKDYISLHRSYTSLLSARFSVVFPHYLRWQAFDTALDTYDHSSLLLRLRHFSNFSDCCHLTFSIVYLLFLLMICLKDSSNVERTCMQIVFRYTLVVQCNYELDKIHH